MLRLLIGAAIISGLSGLFCYLQFIRYHIKAQEKKEAFYLKWHYISLFLLFAIGIAIMFYFGEQQ
jgi:hypothetical protein